MVPQCTPSSTWFLDPHKSACWLIQTFLHTVHSWRLWPTHRSWNIERCTGIIARIENCMWQCTLIIQTYVRYTLSAMTNESYLPFAVNDSCPLLLPSVLWRCWLGVRKGIRPIKSDWWGADLLERSAYSLHMVQLMPLPPIFSASAKSRIVCPSGTDSPE